MTSPLLLFDFRPGGVAPVPPAPTFHEAALVADDAVTRRAAAHLAAFRGWLGAADGELGEFGWPPYHADAARFQAAAHAFYHQAAALDLPVVVWDVVERSDNRVLNAYRQAPEGSALPTFGGTIQSPTNHGRLLEAHLADGWGANYALGAYFGPVLDANNPFCSNARDYYTYDQLESADDLLGEFGYNYGSSFTYGYLAGRGVRSVRLNFRWERVQRALGGPLDEVEMARVDAAVATITDGFGMRCALSASNFATYYADNGATGVRTDVGTAGNPAANLYDLWARLAARYAGNPLVEFDLMNEPAAVSAASWQVYSQGAVDAIRAAGAAQRIIVAGGGFSRPAEFAGNHPGGPWIVDDGPIAYTAHFYYDPSGGYAGTYDALLAAAVAEGY